MESIKVLTIMNRINGKKASSAWNRGVKLYAMEILSNIIEEGNDEFILGDDGKIQRKTWTIFSLSEGFNHWIGISQSGQYLIYDRDIAYRLCTGSELQRCKFGERNPNGREDWLACQGRALYQAATMIRVAIEEELAA